MTAGPRPCPASLHHTVGHSSPSSSVRIPPTSLSPSAAAVFLTSTAGAAGAAAAGASVVAVMLWFRRWKKEKRKMSKCGRLSLSVRECDRESRRCAVASDVVVLVVQRPRACVCALPGARVWCRVQRKERNYDARMGMNDALIEVYRGDDTRKEKMSSPHLPSHSAFAGALILRLRARPPSPTLALPTPPLPWRILQTAKAAQRAAR